MLGSTRRTALQGLLPLIVACPLLLLTACQDVFTYANKSREEGMRLYSEKMYGDAAGAFRTAVRQDPRDYQSHFYLGVCYVEMKEYQQAFQEYYTTLDVMAGTEAGKLDPKFRQQAIDTLALAIAQFDDHETELNKADRRARRNQKAEDWFLLAKVYRLRGDADSALDAYRRAAHWDTMAFEVRKEFGLYLLDPLNQNKEAEYYLRQAYRLEPNDEAVNLALARLGVVPPPAYKAKDDNYPGFRATPPHGPTPTPSADTVALPRD